LLIKCEEMTNLDDFFANLEFEQSEPAQGKLLLSEPFLYDPSFKRSVVLLVEHNEEGSVGFILNKTVDLDVDEALDDFPAFESELYFGGPVSPNSLFYLHTRGDLIKESKEILNGVYWGGDFEQIKLLIDTKQMLPEHIRFFAGYSGWGSDQLKNEMEEKSWIVSDASSDIVFAEDGTEMWSTILRTMGKKYAIISTFPEDPSLN